MNAKRSVRSGSRLHAILAAAKKRMPQRVRRRPVLAFPGCHVLSVSCSTFYPSNYPSKSEIASRGLNRRFSELFSTIRPGQPFAAGIGRKSGLTRKMWSLGRLRKSSVRWTIYGPATSESEQRNFLQDTSQLHPPSLPSYNRQSAVLEGPSIALGRRRLFLDLSRPALPLRGVRRLPRHR